MAIAALVLVGTIDVDPERNGLRGGRSSFFGIGAGFLMSQLGNVIMSSAPPAETNEAGGLQGTAQNLGASLGTALIGSVLLLGPAERVQLADPGQPRGLGRREGGDRGRHRGRHPDRHDRAGALRRCATPVCHPPRAKTVTDDYGDAQLDALKTSMLMVAFLAVLSFWFTRRLPAKPRPPRTSTVAR